MAFKMKYSGSSFPFFGRDKKGETWAEGTSGRQKRIQRRIDKGGETGKNWLGKILDPKGKTKFGRTKYQRNLDRLEAMKKGEMRQKYVHQPIESVDTYEEFYDE